MSQGRINPAMLMQAMAESLADANVRMRFGAKTSANGFAQRTGKINRKAAPGYGACAIAFNSSIKKRMRRARRAVA